MTPKATAPRGEVVFYTSPEGPILDVRIEDDSLWLTQKQMSELFNKDADTIGLHLRNIYNEGELIEAATTEESSVVRKEGSRNVRRKVRLYNLDAILSVGYRVNSKRGTQFRIWATAVLKDHLLKGYSVNKRRLEELHQTIRLITEMADRQPLSGDEATALLRVVAEYTLALDLLDDYDHQRVGNPNAEGKVVYVLTYDEAIGIVNRLRARYGNSRLFGIEKDKGMASALGAIMQTFDGSDVYPSLEEKAAHLLYFLVKNHAFIDGNKRIAAAIFLWFLERNGILEIEPGVHLISDAALVAMTLMIAASRPEEKDVLVRIVTHLLCDRKHSSS